MQCPDNIGRTKYSTIAFLEVHKYLCYISGTVAGCDKFYYNKGVAGPLCV